MSDLSRTAAISAPALAAHRDSVLSPIPMLYPREDIWVKWLGPPQRLGIEVGLLYKP